MPSLRVQILLVVVFGMVCYANSLNVPLQYDDDPTLHVSTAAFMNGAHGVMDFIKTSRFVVIATFALNIALHGELVQGFHIVNSAIHIIAALFVLFLVRDIFRAMCAAHQIRSDEEYFPYQFVPFASALFFVSHPIQTQAVTYISQRYTSLAACLYLAAAHAYVRFRQAVVNGNHGTAWRWGGVSLLSAVLAMKSKEIAFTLPLMLVILEGLLFGGRLLKKPLVPCAVVALLLLVPLQSLLAQNQSGPEAGLVGRLVKASSETALVSRGDYFLTQLRVIVTYIRLLLFPAGQNVDHDYPLFQSVMAPQVLLALGLHLAVATMLVVLVKRYRPEAESGNRNESVVLRTAVFGICWFYGALAVESSIIPISDYINEHRLYLPSAGFFLAFSTGAAVVVARFGRNRQLFYATLLVCGVLSAATIARNQVWGSEMSLWQDSLAKSPGKARPNHSIGKQYYKQWKPELAIPHLVRAVEFEPKKVLYRLTLNNTMSLMNRFGPRVVNGREYVIGEDRIDLRWKAEWLAVSFNNLGVAYEEFFGNQHVARQNYERAVESNPLFAPGWYNLALLSIR